MNALGSGALSHDVGDKQTIEMTIPRIGVSNSDALLSPPQRVTNIMTVSELNVFSHYQG